MEKIGLIDAGDMINKTLIAGSRIPYYSDWRDTAPITGYVEKGMPAGVVDTYLEARPEYGRSYFLWVVTRGAGSTLKTYYVRHGDKVVSAAAAKEQGVLTTKEKAVLKQEANNTITQSITSKIESSIKTAAPWILGALVAVPLLREVIRKKL